MRAPRDRKGKNERIESVVFCTYLDLESVEQVLHACAQYDT
jgi:hypothetical protein